MSLRSPGSAACGVTRLELVEALRQIHRPGHLRDARAGIQNACDALLDQRPEAFLDRQRSYLLGGCAARHELIQIGVHAQDLHDRSSTPVAAEVAVLAAGRAVYLHARVAT